MLKRYAEKNPLRLHMPGHKGKSDDFLSEFSRFDLTELSQTDNLFEPFGEIARAEELYAGLFNAKHAYFSVNGSSAGNFAFVAESNTLALDRLSHKSLFATARLMNKNCVVMERNLSGGLPEPVNLIDVKNALELYKEIDAFVLTSPDYYGRTVDLEPIYAFLRSRGVRLFVDSAHGAHFGLSPFLPKNAVNFCDACIVSVHKTLGGLNQTAVLLSNADDTESLRDKFYSFMTTSPSFGLMASIDIAREYASENSYKYENIRERKLIFEERIKELGLFLEKNDDFTRVVINCSAWKIPAEDISAFLEKENVFFEMADDVRLVAIITLYDDEDVFDRLFVALKKVRENLKDVNVTSRAEGFAKTNYKALPSAFMLKRGGKVKEVPIYEAEGMISAQTVLKMPPCVPIVLDGEVVTKEAIAETCAFNAKLGKEKKTLKVRYERIDND